MYNEPFQTICGKYHHYNESETKAILLSYYWVRGIGKWIRSLKRFSRASELSKLAIIFLMLIRFWSVAKSKDSLKSCFENVNTLKSYTWKWHFYVKGLVNLQNNFFQTPIDWKANNERNRMSPPIPSSARATPSPTKKFKIVIELWRIQNIIRWKYARGSYDVIWAFWNIKFNILLLF